MIGGEDDSISIQAGHNIEKQLSSSDEAHGPMRSIPRRCESASNVLSSFGNMHFNEEVKSEGLSSVKKFIEENELFLHLWNDVLVLMCIIATLLDPLFCYVLFVDEDRKCIGFDKKLRVTVVVLRSLVDFAYIILIVFHLRIGYIAPRNANDRGVCAIAWRYFLSYLTVDILAALPLPQVLILILVPKVKGSHFTTAMRSLKFVLIIQYLPRVFRVCSFLKKVRWSSSILPDSAGAKAVFNLFLYMLASHVFGALWYLCSVERIVTCWQHKYEIHPHYPLNCKYSNGERFLRDDYCSGKASMNTTAAFEFGIFGDALKFDVVHSSTIWKISYCYWWGLQNLSSLGQGLKTSKYIWEIYFAVAITTSGLVLFAFLIGNLQTFLQATTARLEEMRLKGQDIELWMRYHSLPPDLKKRIKQYEKYKWRETRGVDVENILDSLPRDLKRATTRHLCLGAITSVPMLQNMDEKFLDAVCGFLKPVLYIERNFFVRQGEPLDEMIFIIRGRLWIYSTSNGEAASGSSGSEGIARGDNYGADLLHWVLRDPFLSTVPISTKTVRAHTKVEAFVLRASDLKCAVTRFWWLFSRELRNDPGFKERWAPWAALILQAAWRRYYRNKREKEKSQLKATKGKNAECLVTTTTAASTTTTVIASRFIARALRAVKQRQESNDLPESSKV